MISVANMFLKRFFKLLGVKVKLSSTFHLETNGKMEWVNQILEQYLQCTSNYHQDNWSDILFVAWFSYNNTMHLTTQQTPLFANHGLHPMFDIQGVNNVMNHVAKDQVAWLANIWTQLVSNLEEVRRWYKETIDEHCKE
jgi:hypothetical protein